MKHVDSPDRMTVRNLELDFKNKAFLKDSVRFKNKLWSQNNMMEETIYFYGLDLKHVSE